VNAPPPSERGLIKKIKGSLKGVAAQGERGTASSSKESHWGENEEVRKKEGAGGRKECYSILYGQKFTARRATTEMVKNCESGHKADKVNKDTKPREKGVLNKSCNAVRDTSGKVGGGIKINSLVAFQRGGEGKGKIDPGKNLLYGGGGEQKTG